MNELKTVLWGASDRSVRRLMAQLEALGFALPIDDHGSRRVPETVALAVGVCREQGRPLEELTHQGELQGYLRRDADPDPLAELIELRTEVTILREVIGEVYRAMILDTSNLSYRQTDFKGLGVPDPRRGL